MKKTVLLVSLLLLLFSCVPTRIAPSIQDYKVTKGRNFKRSLPKRQMFIFKDPKPTNQFYTYINTKFQLNDINVYNDIPFSLKEKQYFFSFYEVEIPNKSINLVPLAVDAFLVRADLDPIMEDHYATRKGNWYPAIEVYSDTEQDCLAADSASNPAISEYFRMLKNEYLGSDNYNEILFKN